MEERAFGDFLEIEKIIMDICRYILDNLDNEITMDKIEEVFYYNKFYLIRLFKTYTGYTIKEFINSVKILKTIDPLLFTDDTILKIALNNGFNSQEYYSEKFKNIIGMSPFRFRKEYKNISELNNIKELKKKREYLLYLKNFQNSLLKMQTSLEYHNDAKKLKKVI